MTVTVEDAQGNTVTAASGTVSLALTPPGGATLTAGGAAPVTSGVATFGGLSVNKVGSYTLTPSTTVSGVTTLPASGSFAVTVGAASQLVFTQQPTAVVAGATMSPAVTVTVEDAQGNTVTGASGTVSLALTTPGGATLTGGGAVAVSSGVATFGGLRVDKVATYTFTPTTTVAGVTTLPLSNSFAVTTSAISASVSTVSASPSTITAGGSGSTITVTVLDASSNPVPNISVFLAARGATGLSQPLAPTNASGVTTGTLSSTLAGQDTVIATAGGVTLAQQPIVTVTAGAASQIAVSAGNGQSATAGTAVATAPAVVVRDANNNPVSGVSVTFAVVTGGGTVAPKRGPACTS